MVKLVGQTVKHFLIIIDEDFCQQTKGVSRFQVT